MGITGSVGALGTNDRNDVKLVQVLLNFGRPPPLPALDVDGLIGPDTLAAIREYQSRVVHMPAPDGRVDPGGGTLRALKQGIPQDALYPGHVQGIALAAPPERVSLFFPGLSSHLAEYGMTTALRRAHFFAQICHESAELRYTEEIASGAAYEGRVDLGNTQPGDGCRFKGRGLIQLTGRSNYVAFGKAVGQDFTTDAGAARLATDPDLACQVAFWFWKTRGLNALADADDLNAITRRINGGLNGLADRQALYERARFMLDLG